MSNFDDQFKDFVKDNITDLCGDGDLITPADLYASHQEISHLSKKAKKRLLHQFIEEQPDIAGDISEYAQIKNNPDAFGRHISSIMVVIWHAYKRKCPNLLGVTQADLKDINDHCCGDEFHLLPHRQFLGAALLMLSFKLNDPKYLELELGYMLIDAIIVNVTAMDMVFRESIASTGYVNDYYKTLRKEAAEENAAFEADMEVASKMDQEVAKQ